MSWFLLGDVPHTRRRGIAMRIRYLFDGVLAKTIHASKHYDPDKELQTVRVDTSNVKSILFEVWQRDRSTPIDDARYTVFYVRVSVSDELLEQVCEGNYGRAMKRSWCSE